MPTVLAGATACWFHDNIPNCGLSFFTLKRQLDSRFSFCCWGVTNLYIFTTVVFGQRLLPHNIGLASGLLLGFGVGMGSIGVTVLGAIADYAGLPLTMNIISLLPILGIVLAFILPDIRAGQLGAKEAGPGKALQQV